MASLLGHAVVPLALGRAFSAEKQSLSFWLLAVYCSVIPDGDAISFWFGIPYGHLLGHRGFSHSIFFAAIIAFIVVCLFFRAVPRYSARWWQYAIFFFVVMISHAVSDALSNGGLGVAFFAPFSNQRFFFAWRPLEVSPIGGLSYFFTHQGWVIIRSELTWIWMPSLIIVLASILLRTLRNQRLKRKEVS